MGAVGSISVLNAELFVDAFVQLEGEFTLPFSVVMTATTTTATSPFPPAAIFVIIIALDPSHCL